MVFVLSSNKELFLKDETMDGALKKVAKTINKRPGFCRKYVLPFYKVVEANNIKSAKKKFDGEVRHEPGVQFGIF